MHAWNFSEMKTKIQLRFEIISTFSLQDWQWERGFIIKWKILFTVNFDLNENLKHTHTHIS